MNWLDLGLIIFLIIFIIIGIKRGFMSSVMSNFTFGTVAILAFFLCKPLASLLNKWFNLENAIFSTQYSKLVNSSSNFEVNLLSLAESDLKGFVSSTITAGPISSIPKIMFNWFLNTKSLYSKLHESGLASRSLGEIVGSTYASFYTSLISFAITLIILYLIIWIFNLFINKLRKIGLIKVVDSILGAVYGIGRALIIIIVCCLFIKILSPISFMSYVTNYISNSFFGKLFYNQINNLLDNYLYYEDLINLIFKR